MGYFKSVHELAHGDRFWMGFMVILSPIAAPVWWVGHLFDKYMNGGD